MDGFFGGVTDRLCGSYVLLSHRIFGYRYCKLPDRLGHNEKCFERARDIRLGANKEHALVLERNSKT